jgi:regulator of RNase E activity RraA
MPSAVPIQADLQKRLYAAVLSDVLDGMGLRDQAMKPFIRPLDEESVLFGRARTGLYMPVYEVREGENPYEVEIALVDDLRPHDVAVFSCGGPTDRIAPWGELLSTAAMRSIGFPVFHGGIGPLDSKGRGKMVERDVPVMCAGVLVRPGDYVFGDADGVVVVPQDAAEEAFSTALAKVEAETTTRSELAAGEKLADVFRRHGIL